ncbi:MAG: hypothetical protein CL678_01675 [Bdellovibrionaceae bacterium]|nr:hypothetical protein [Pseudobdellovibrionaceae bacterium]|tara:strand:+ start:5461 stop:5946 length:486 start_codon:yes stop_codon:yes gene_type:complete
MKISLLPFEQSPFNVQIEISQDQHTEIRFKVCGPVSELENWEVPFDLSREDRIWESTCFEVFLTEKDSTRYQEVNLSRTGAWNLYSFDSTRVGMKPSDPFFEFEAISDGVRLLLPHGVCLEKIGISTILKEKSGKIHYFALCHIGDRPDFHARETWTLSLD